MTRAFSLILLGTLAVAAECQTLPLSRDLRLIYQPAQDSLHGFHASVSPWMLDEIQPVGLGSFYCRPARSGDSVSSVSTAFRPLLNTAAGYGNRFLYRAGAGAELLVRFQKGLRLDLQYMYHAALWPAFYDSLRTAGYVPHAGRASYKATGGQMQWGSLTGSLSWIPLRPLVLEAGIGRNFWGEGYRSLFLSDKSNAYPFFRTTVRVWHIKYVSLLGFLQDVSLPGSQEKLLPKYGAFHYLSWNVSRRLNLSFFEAVIWNGNDSIRHRKYDFQYMIPVVVYRPVEHWIGSPDNALLGAGGSYSLFPGWSLYTQFLLDELVLKEFLQGTGWAGNKYALQAGVKAHEPFGQKGMQWLAELNLARPYTWSHRSTLNNYGAWYQPLAHPAGGNFVEGLVEGKYRSGKYLGSVFVSWTAAGKDSGTFNAGSDIYQNYTSEISLHNVEILQGNPFRQLVWSVRFGQLLIPRLDLLAEIQAAGRFYRSEGHRGKEFFLGISLRTLLFNDVWFE